MMKAKNEFTARIEIIGVNPYVVPPAAVLKKIFEVAGKDRGPITVRGKINGNDYLQTLVKFRGKWRLYLNTPMRRQANLDVGDRARFTIVFDGLERSIPMHPKLEEAFKNDAKALAIFNSLAPYRRKEIMRYINALKSEDSRDRNISKALAFLAGKGRFAGRSKSG